MYVLFALTTGAIAALSLPCFSTWLNDVAKLGKVTSPIASFGT
jgi:hypothetical protein